MEALLPVLRALIDAAFSSGGITDLAHRDLHAMVDAADPAAAEAARRAEVELSPAEEAELARLQAKQAAASIPGPTGAVFGSESQPYA